MPELRTFLTIGTGHLTKETADWLNGLDFKKEGPAGGATAYGWFFYAHDDNVCQGAPHAPEGEFPPDLWGIFKKTRELGAQYVMLDCDAAPLDDLPTYEW